MPRRDRVEDGYGKCVQRGGRNLNRLRTSSIIAGVLVALGLLPGCARTIPRNGIADAAVADKAVMPGYAGVRFWADEAPKNPIAELRRRAPNLPSVGRHAGIVNGRPLIETLALTGGGADGAFGAGVLAGWTKRGDRPEFEVVTGVSAGAIIAPFAFLGPSEDEKLRQIWTEYEASDIATKQFFSGLFGGEALVDTGPMEKLMDQYITPEFLRRVAAEYHRGRMLMVLTTNLDAQRPVVWNMGELARIGTPEALVLFRKVILASSAVPGAFPPVNIPVQSGGKAFEELHVDGGTTRQVFVLPVQAPLRAFDGLFPAPPLRRIYILKNGKLNAEQEVVPQKTLQIASRALATLIKSQNWSEIDQLYHTAREAGADFNLIAVPPGFDQKTKEIYDPVYQKALYEQGLMAGRRGQWLKQPPLQAPAAARKSVRRPVMAQAPAKPEPAPRIPSRQAAMALPAWGGLVTPAAAEAARP